MLSWCRCMDLHSGSPTGCLTLYELCNPLSMGSLVDILERKKEEEVGGRRISTKSTHPVVKGTQTGCGVKCRVIGVD